jgi:hypothetical protein
MTNIKKNQMWSDDYYIIPVTSEIKTKFRFDEEKPDYKAEMLFLLFLTRANWSQDDYEYLYKGNKIKLKRGQLVYNRVLFSNMLNITPNGSDKVLDRLVRSYEAVTVLPVKIEDVKTFVITIQNYDFYLSKNEPQLLCSDEEVMDELHNSSMNKKDKKDKKNKKENFQNFEKITDEILLYGSPEHPKPWQVWKPQTDKDCINNPNLIWEGRCWDDITKI